MFMNFLNTHSRIILLKNVNESTAQECLCSGTIHFINYVFIKVAVGENYVYELCVYDLFCICVPSVMMPIWQLLFVNNIICNQFAVYKIKKNLKTSCFLIIPVDNS